MDFFHGEEAESITDDQIFEYIGFAELSPEANRALGSLIGLKDSFSYTVWDEILDEFKISEYSNLSKKILDYIFFIETYRDNDLTIYYEEDKKVPKYSSGVFFNELLSRRQLRLAVQYHEPLVEYKTPEMTFRIVADRIIELGVDLRIQLAVVSNTKFFKKVVQVPSVLNAIFPSKMGLFLMLEKRFKPIKRSLRYTTSQKIYGMEFEDLLCDISENSPLTVEEIDYAHNKLYVNNFNFYCFQILPLNKLLEYGINSKIAWSLSSFDPHVEAPKFTRKNDITMVSMNMPISSALRCSTTKSDSVLKWLAIVGPQEVLPNLLGVNDPVLRDFISKRMQGIEIDKEDFRVLRAKILRRFYHPSYLS